MYHKISHRQWGEQGPLLVLVHGFGGGPRQWELLVPQLSKKFRVVVVNMTHVYVSRNPLLFGLQVEIFNKYIKTHFGNEKIFLCGISYGGLLSWAASLRAPALYDELFLVNPMLPDPLRFVHKKEIRYLLRIPFTARTLSLLLSNPIGRIFLRKMETLFRDRSASKSRRIENLRGRKLYFIVQMIQIFSWILRQEDWSWWQKFNAKASPTSINLIVCEDDPLFSLQSFYDFSHAQEKCEMTVLEKGGHLVSLSEPGALAQIFLDFLEQTERNGSHAKKYDVA